MKASIRSIALLATLVLLTATVTAWAQVWYVIPDGIGAGANWNDATSLTQALAMAGVDDPIWLAEGGYTNDATFSITSSRSLYGGFTNGMATFAERDPETYPALLYGQDFTNGRVVTVTAGGGTTVILDGLVISNSYDASSIPLNFLAGGIAKTGAGHLILSHCRIVNHAGQRGTLGNGVGCHFSGGTVMITNCVFSNNTLYHDVNGGGIYSSGADLEIVDSVFSGTKALSTSSRGGGIWFNNGSLRVWRTDFIDNAVWATSAGGGAVYLGNSANNRVTFSNCVFTGNSIVNPPPTARDGNGGAVGAIQHGTVTSRFVHCAFLYNTNFAYSGTANKGGAVHLGGGTLELLNCKLAHNTCNAGSGGAVSVAGATSRLVLRNCTLAYNTSELGGGSIVVDAGTLDLVNSISWTNSIKNSMHADKGHEIYVGANGTLNVGFSAVAGTRAPYLHADGGATVNLPSAMTNDPLFVSSTDLHVSSPAGRWDPDLEAFVMTDTVYSPAIDAGDPDDPVGYETAPHGNRINLGVYGGTLQASRSPTAAPQVANFRAVNDYTRMVIGAELINDTPVIATVGICYGTTRITGLTTNGWDTVHLFYPPQQTGTVVSIMTPYLLTNTTYYHRAFATNGYGLHWAPVGSFTTGPDYPPGWGVGGGPDVIHVKHDAIGEGTGIDWFNAYTQVADATTAAGGSRTHIWIASGTYEESGTIIIPGSMILLSGFSGTETNALDRDVAANPVLLYGGGAERRVVTVTAGADTTVILDGLVITNSFPETLPTWYDAGGISKTGAGHLILSHCRIVGHAMQRANGVGGHFTAGTVMITNCVFANNRIAYQVNGGGIYASGADIEIVDSVFIENRATSGLSDGSGIWFNNGILRVWQTDFIDNAVGATSGSGGAVYLGNSAANRVTFSDCVFRGNSVLYTVSGRNGEGAALKAIQHASVTSRFVNCDFLANTNFADPTSRGGAIHLGGGTLELLNCKLAYNTCDKGNGGAVNVAGATSRLLLRNCTLAYNTSRDGGGAIYLDSGALDLHNSIVWTNWATAVGATGHEILCTGGVLNATYSLITATNAPYVVSTGSGIINFGEGILTAEDPLFASATDVRLQSKQGRWDPVDGKWVQDQRHSPAIDAGDPNDAVGDEPVPHGRRINMGAYGGTWQASHSLLHGTLLRIR